MRAKTGRVGVGAGLKRGVSVGVKVLLWAVGTLEPGWNFHAAFY